MAAGPWVIYNDFLVNFGLKLINLDTDDFKVALFDSSSIAINEAVVGAGYTAFAADGHEVPNGNGYTTGGEDAANPTYVGGGATATGTFDTDNVSWTGADDGFTARAAVLYSDTSVGKLAVAYCLLDSTPQDLTVGAGEQITLAISTVFVLSKAA